MCYWAEVLFVCIVFSLLFVFVYFLSPVCYGLVFYLYRMVSYFVLVLPLIGFVPFLSFLGFGS